MEHKKARSEVQKATNHKFRKQKNLQNENYQSIMVTYYNLQKTSWTTPQAKNELKKAQNVTQKSENINSENVNNESYHIIKVNNKYHFWTLVK